MKKLLLIFIPALFSITASVAQVTVLQCHNKGLVSDMNEAYLISYSLNCTPKEYLACGTQVLTPQLAVAVISPDSCVAWGTPGFNIANQPVNQSNNFGQLNANGSCGRSRVEWLFYWNQANATSMTSLATFLNTTVPDSAYVLIYTWIPNQSFNYNGTTYPSAGSFTPWLQTNLDAFHNLGFTGIDNIALDRPWIFFAKKGDIASAQALVGATADATLDFQTTICGPSFITADSTQICPGNSTVLSGPAGLSDYLWSTGETTQSITVSAEGYYALSGLIDSTYQSSDSSYIHCYYTDSVFVNVSCTGIEELENSFSVYPNPAKEMITITLTSLLQKPAQVVIQTMYGVVTQHTEIPAGRNKFELPVNELPPGIYFITINTGNRYSRSQKVVIF